MLSSPSRWLAANNSAMASQSLEFNSLLWILQFWKLHVSRKSKIDFFTLKLMSFKLSTKLVSWVLSLTGNFGPFGSLCYSCFSFIHFHFFLCHFIFRSRSDNFVQNFTLDTFVPSDPNFYLLSALISPCQVAPNRFGSVPFKLSSSPTTWSPLSKQVKPIEATFFSPVAKVFRERPLKLFRF